MINYTEFTAARDRTGAKGDPARISHSENARRHGVCSWCGNAKDRRLVPAAYEIVFDASDWIDPRTRQPHGPGHLEGVPICQAHAAEIRAQMATGTAPENWTIMGFCTFA